MTCAVFAFPDDRAPAERLGDMLGAPLHPIHPHSFPDGESRPTAAGGVRTALLYRTLARPDAKLMPLLLAADALRRAETQRVVLVAPYLPYQRQDQVFRPGEPLSRDVFAHVLAPAFDRIVTVEPHLHRTGDLARVFGATPLTVLPAAPLLATAIGRRGRPLVVGPDAESEPLAAAIAARLSTDHRVGVKQRLGDESVRLALGPGAAIAGRRVALVDDICASGATLHTVLGLLREAGAASIEVFVVHALFSAETGEALRAAGADRIVSTDSCHHGSSELHLAGLLADALREELTA
jgi:ribose-phosphate pyrophosphokinase